METTPTACPSPLSVSFQGHIVVATDGKPQSRGALAVARAIAEHGRSDIRVICVHDSTAVLVPVGEMLVSPDVAASARADLTRRVREQCRDLGAERPDVFEILNGQPARVITERATSESAQLIVMGLGRHEIVDRIFGDETALKVARASKVPVLAVPEDSAAIPTHAIVGVDFSEGSLRAAKATLKFLPAGGVIELAHVIPRERLIFDAWVSQEEYVRYVRHSLTRFRARLAVPESVRIDEAVLSGDPAKELENYAVRVGADLIATGSHGEGFVSRIVLGSVTTKLLRTATCAVLVIPPDAEHSDRLGASANATLTLERSRWSEVLDDFTRRNVGRRTRLEIDDPEIGAQAQEWDYPLLGVTFDPIDDRVEIMLGELGVGEPHLSRSIGEVDSLDVLTNRDAQDVALRLRHGSGQTLLTLIR